MSFFRRADSDSSDSSSEEEELLSDVEEKDEQAAPSKAAPAAPAKKSRFAASSGSESESDSESEEDDSEAEASKAAPAAKPKGSRFAAGSESDSDESEDEGKRVVKSAKSKRAEELEAAAKKVENAARIDDWVTVNGEFDKMTRMATNNPGNLLATVTLPPTYLKLLISVNESVAETSAKKTKMSATHNRNLNTMKQKVKKLQREHEGAVQKYKDDPEGYAREFEGPVETAPPPKKVKKPTTTVAEGEAEDDDFMTVGKGGKTMSLTPETVLKTLQSVLEARGKKSTDRSEQLRVLEKLLSIAATPYAKIRVLLALISSLFDYSTASFSYLPLEQWASARTRFEELLDLLNGQPQYVVREEVAEYDEQEERAPTAEKPTVEIRGSLLSLVERLDDEFTRSLKDIDPHAVEYVERLKDETKVYVSLARACSYCEKTNATEALNRLTMRRLEHVYNKPDAVIAFLESSLPSLSSSIWSSPPPTDPENGALVRALCAHLYKPQVGPRLRTRAILCQVYHYALHNDFYRARDLLLMSHVPQETGSLEVEAMILYNRTIAQLGLSAFRNGLIEETESLLRDLYSNTSLVKEKLAQGTQRRGLDYAATAEQERLDKARGLPFHQHINLELLECSYLVSSMLIEVPQIALEEYDAERKRDVKSRMFRRQLDVWDRTVFSGPPENKREHIIQAAKALQKGDWHRSIELIEGIKVWSLLPGLKSIKSLLSQRIQEEALRVYLYTHAGFYATISLDYLATTFELPLARVTALVSSMIWNETIAASLDRKSTLLVLHRENRSALQQMALVLADRISAGVNENERTAALKFGDSESGRDNRGDRQSAQDGSGGQRRGRSGRGRGGHRGGGGRNPANANFGQTMGRALKA